MTYGKNPQSITSRLRAYFEDRPGRTVTIADLARSYRDLSPAQIRGAVNNLRNGAVDRMPIQILLSGQSWRYEPVTVTTLSPTFTPAEEEEIAREQAELAKLLASEKYGVPTAEAHAESSNGFYAVGTFRDGRTILEDANGALWRAERV